MSTIRTSVSSGGDQVGLGADDVGDRQRLLPGQHRDLDLAVRGDLGVDRILQRLP